jgi:hypothetical protein
MVSSGRPAARGENGLARLSPDPRAMNSLITRRLIYDTPCRGVPGYERGQL